MKGIVFFIIILFSVYIANAQRYIQFESSAEIFGSHWSIDGLTLQVDYEDFTEELYLEVSADSMIQNGQLVTYFSNYHDIQLYINENRESFIYLWEDSISDMMMGIYPHYYPDLLATKSVVLYDYNQSVGDTVNSDVINLSSDSPFVITNIDTIDYAGVARRTLACQSTNGSFVSFNIIEGLGTDLGFLTNVDEWIEGGENMECAYFDGVHTYGDSECYVTIKDNQVNIQASPNPFQDNLNIQFSERIQGHLTILDLQGKICHQEKLSSFWQTINLESLKVGIYIMTITDVNGIIMANQKILKQ